MNARVSASLIGWLFTAALLVLSLRTTDETPLDIGLKLVATIIGVFTLALSFIAAADATSTLIGRDGGRDE